MEIAEQVSLKVLKEGFYKVFTEADANELWPVMVTTLTEILQTLPSNNAPTLPTPLPTPEHPGEVNLYFPKIVEMLLKKNIKLHMEGCKTHISQSGNMSLVSPIFGGGYYGTFNTAGFFRPRRECKPEFIDQLRDIEDNGVEAAKRIGMLTGNCCVCGRTLTNEGSVEAGIGPICAGKAF